MGKKKCSKGDKGTKEPEAREGGRKGGGEIMNGRRLLSDKARRLLKGLWDWPLRGHESLRGQGPLGGHWSSGSGVAW